MSGGLELRATDLTAPIHIPLGDSEQRIDSLDKKGGLKGSFVEDACARCLRRISPHEAIKTVDRERVAQICPGIVYVDE